MNGSKLNIKYCDGKLLKQAILAGTSWLNEKKEIVNGLNVFPVPDGDTGTNMFLTLRMAVEKIKKISSPSLLEILEALRSGTLQGSRGCSGLVLSQFFKGIREGADKKSKLNSLELAEALQKGVKTAYQSMTNPLEGTILTVLRESVDSASNAAKTSNDLITMLDEMYAKAKESLTKTRDLLPALKEANVVDAGGAGIVFVLEGILRLIYKVPIKALSPLDLQEYVPTIKIAGENILNLYCVECQVKGGDLNPNKIRKNLIGHGEAVMVAGSHKLIKVHIHTSEPGAVLRRCAKWGKVDRVKIDNLREQIRNFQKRWQEKAFPELKKIGIVAVAAGAGLMEILASMGADVVLDGGSTMNPSFENLKEAAEKLEAKNILLLPNHPNVFFVAHQLQKLNKKISLVPSKTIPQGIAALLSFNPEQELEINLKTMKKVLAKIKTGYVTYAARESKIKGEKIKKGDILGFADDEIKVIGKSLQKAALELLEKMFGAQDELLTIFYGQKVTKQKAEELQTRVKKKFPQLEIQIYDGGQPYYYYIFSIE